MSLRLTRRPWLRLSRPALPGRPLDHFPPGPPRAVPPLPRRVQVNGGLDHCTNDHHRRTVTRTDSGSDINQARPRGGPARITVAHLNPSHWQAAQAQLNDCLPGWHGPAVRRLLARS
jgi:hypothetical protein